jgi:hypothetical protein
VNCGAGAESRGAEIKLPSEAGTKNSELRLELLSIYQRLEEILIKKILVAKEVFENYYSFSPIWVPYNMHQSM